MYPLREAGKLTGMVVEKVMFSLAKIPAVEPERVIHHEWNEKSHLHISAAGMHFCQSPNGGTGHTMERKWAYDLNKVHFHTNYDSV